MNYRSDKYGNQLSILGFGCMRFPQNLGIIDMKETEGYEVLRNELSQYLRQLERRSGDVSNN